jgi:hypothetical protein
VEIADHLWLTKSHGLPVCEQTLAQMNDYRMTLLTVERDENEAQEDVWEPPRFR